MCGKCLMIVMLLTFVGVFLSVNGCKKSGEENSNAEGADKTVMLLCIKCGQVKGNELCCKLDQVKCPKCGLAKGSPGCCKIPKDMQTMAMCSKCGKIIGGKLCCACDVAKCPIEEFKQTHKYPAPVPEKRR